MAELKDKEVEVDGKKISAESIVRLNIKTIIWIVGVLFTGLSAAAGWAYFDLRSELKAATEISSQEKEEFLDDVEDQYEHKFEKMFDDISDIKGDVKVMLDRSNRVNPVLPNPGVQVQPQLPPPGSAQPPGN